MNHSSHPTLQPLIEEIRRKEDAKKITELIATFEQSLGAIPQDDPARIDFLLTVGEVLYEKGQYKDASRLLEAGAEQARTAQIKGRQALALGLMADINRVQGNYRNALSKLVQAREVLGQNPEQDKDVSARLHVISGLNNMSLGDYGNSRNSFYEAYQIYSQIGDLKGKALAANRLGTVATMQSEYIEAEKYLQESLSLTKQLNDQHGMAGALLNLGEVQRHLGQFTEARACYVEASRLFSELGLHRGMCIAENNLGHIAVQLQDHPSSRQHYMVALECAKIANLTPDKLDTLAGLAIIFVQRGQCGEAARLIQFVLRHPAHLQETEEFLESAQQVIANKQTQPVIDVPSPDQLERVIAETLEKIF
ncbi:MAG: tetratricopeptide repeat protein [Chloroflexi bacterium]|nr:tetratricopeptide repeat protein [Chloroflexota bacterium]